MRERMDFKFKDVSEDDVVYTDNIYYDLFDGGYIDLDELLTDGDQASKVWQAVRLIKSFLEAAEEAGVVEIS